MDKAAVYQMLYRLQCPSEHRLAAYCDGALDSHFRAAIEGHLLNCPDCCEQVGATAAILRSDASSIPLGLAARARALVPAEMPANRNVIRPPVGAAMLVVVAVGAAVFSYQPNPHAFSISEPAAVKEPLIATSKPAPLAHSSEDAFRGNRNVPQGSRRFSASVSHDAGIVNVRWTAVHDAAFYDVTVVNAEGDIVWSTRTAKLAIEVPHSEVDAARFAMVRAVLPNGKSLQSQAVAIHAK